MRVLGRGSRVPLLRTGLFSSGGVAVALGVAGLACVVRGIRAARRHRKQLSLTAKAAAQDGGREPLAKGSIEPAQPRGDEIELLDEELPLGPKELWRLLFDHNFVQSFHDRMGCRECSLGKWGKSGDKLQRRAQYVKPLKKNALGPREAFTEEEYSCSQRGDSGFSVAVAAFTRKVPYGGSFHVELRWTASRISPNRTRLRVVGGIVFEKRVLVAGIIKRATNEGLRESYASYREHLWQALNNRKPPGKEAASQPRTSALRSASTATKIAAEDLVKNGIFVSWGELIGGCLCLWLLVMAVRLAWAQNGRLLTFERWREASLRPVLI